MNINVLLGKTLTRCEKIGNDRIEFDAGNEKFVMLHVQDCCENVLIEDICGELSDLVGSPILQSEETTNRDQDPEGYKREHPSESMTWTFYRLATAKGQVVIRWYGESNGYYSESVDFEQITQ